MSILLFSTDLERFSYLVERDGFNLITFLDQKEKTIPENWPVDFVDGGEKKFTLEILMDSKMRELKEKIGARLVYVFKNNFLIEKELARLELSTLNPPAELTEKIEGKISQADFFYELKEYFPEFIIAEQGAVGFQELKNILCHPRDLPANVCGIRRWQAGGGDPENGSWILGQVGNDNCKLIAQFNTSHSGAGTFELSENLWQEWQQKFPQRPIRVSKFVAGETLTLNLVVLPTAIILGVPSIQLTGVSGLTEHRFTTVGNAWITFDGETKKQIEVIAKSVGAVLQKNNFFGPAGLDLIKEEKTGKIYLIEINARQPASFNLESWLAKLANRKGLFDYLVDFWQGKILPPETEPLAISGGQIVVRAKSDWCGIIKSTPKTGIYGLDNGQMVFVAERPFLASKNEFLAHFLPPGRELAPGQEVFRVQTGKNFINSKGELDEEIVVIIDKLKERIVFE